MTKRKRFSQSLEASSATSEVARVLECVARDPFVRDSSSKLSTAVLRLAITSIVHRLITAAFSSPKAHIFCEVDDGVVVVDALVGSGICTHALRQYNVWLSACNPDTVRR